MPHDSQRRAREAAGRPSTPRETAHARLTQDAAEKKVKDAKDLLEQAEKRQKEAEALPESTDPEAAAKASQHAKCALVIIACKKQEEAAHRQTIDSIAYAPTATCLSLPKPTMSFSRLQEDEEFA